MHTYEIRPHKDGRGFDLISDALPSGRLWYLEVRQAIDHSKHQSRSHDAVIRVYDLAGKLIEVHRHKGIQRAVSFTRITLQFPLGISNKLIRPEKPVIKGGIFGPNYSCCSNVHIDTNNTKYLWVDFVVHRCRDADY
jgi:hypothetical protein